MAPLAWAALAVAFLGLDLLVLRLLMARRRREPGEAEKALGGPRF